MALDNTVNTSPQKLDEMNTRNTSFAASALLFALLAVTPLVQAEDGPPGYGFAQRCDEPGATLSKLETIACNSETLRAQEKNMLDLVQAVSEETAGFDGETGEPINTMAKEQNAWRNAKARMCHDAICLSAAYKARIANIRRTWADALPSSSR